MTRRRRSVPGGGSKGGRGGAHRDLEPPPARPVLVDEQLLWGNLLVAGVEAIARHSPTHNKIVDPGTTLRESSSRTDRDQVTTKRGSEVSPASASSTTSGDQGRVASGSDLRSLA